MPYSQNKQENWQDLSTTLPRLKWKVILGGILVSVILVLFLVVSHKSLNTILHSVEKLSTPKDNAKVLNKLMLQITDIEWNSGKYIASRNIDDLDEYFESVDHTEILIDSISNKFGKDYPKKIDSLQQFFNSYISTADAYIQLKTTNGLKNDYQLLQMIRSEKEGLNKLEPNNNTTSTNNAQINPIPDPVKVEEKANELDKSSKIKRKRGRKPQVQEIEEVKPQVIDQKIEKTDSTIIKKYNSLVDNVQNTVQSGLKTKLALQKNTLETEQDILIIQRSLFEQLKIILADLEQKEIEASHSESLQANSQVVKNAKYLSWITILIIFILLVLVIITFSDVSKSVFYRDKLQEARVLAEKQAIAKEDFLSNMSHEIRTPLTSIIGFAEQLNEGDLQPGQKAKVHALIRSGDHLISLVNDILDYTKIESGSLKLESIGFSITDIIDEVIEVMEPEARRKGIDILFEPSRITDLLVEGDPVRLRQILLNLVGNAVKFTHKGSVEISVEKKKKEQKKVLLEFTVSDTGVGIPLDKLNTVFSKFEQADTEVSRKYGGSGLGLSISRKLVEMQNGIIYANSIEGEGSRFSFQIPYVLTEKNQYQVATDQTNTETGLIGRRILVVDDDPMTEILLKPMLGNNGAFTRFEKNPLVALNICETEYFDVIITDLHMPQLDGISFLEKLKSNPKFNSSQTILCTGNVLKEISSKAVDFILYKPYKMGDLMKIFESISNAPFTASEPLSEEEFSLDYFNTFAGGDPAQLKMFVDLFIKNSHSEIEKIKQNFSVGNTEAVGESAHLLKNTYGQLKARESMRVIARLEGLVDEKYLNDDEIKKLISELEMSSETLYGNLHKSIENHQTSNP